MLHLIKMDLYRLFHSLSTWIIMVVSMMFAVLSVVLIYTETASGMAVKLYSNVEELLSAQLSGGILMIFCTIFVTVFVSAEFKNGYLKNFAGQLPYRGMLILSKALAIAIGLLLYFFTYAGSVAIAGKLFFGDALAIMSVPDIIKLLAVQYAFHCGFGYIVLFFYLLRRSTVFSILAGIFASFGIAEASAFHIGRGASLSAYMQVVVVGFVFAVVGIVFSVCVIEKRDIK